MTLETFADKYRLRLKKDDCRDLYIPAKYGQIYYWGKGLLGVMVLSDSAKVWGHRLRAFEKLGVKVIQNGDSEGAAIFDPKDLSVAKAVIRLIGARGRRRLAPEMAVQTAARLKVKKRMATIA